MRDYNAHAAYQLSPAELADEARRAEMRWLAEVADLEANDDDLDENEARRRRAQNGRV